MKWTSENYEFLLFELLEGNLDAEKAEEVRREIEKDAFLQEEWKLMQQTVLQDEPVSFRNKKALLKPEGPRLIAFMPLVKYAAAAVLVVSVWAGLQFYNAPDKDLASDRPVEQPVVKPMEKKMQVPVSDDVAGMDYKTPEPAGTADNHNDGKSAKVVQAEVVLSSEPIKNNNNIDNIYKEFVRAVSPRAISGISGTQPVAVEIAPLNGEMAMAVNHTDPVAEIDNYNGSLRERINQGVADLMGPFSNPKVRISRAGEAESKLAFNIAFTSAEYTSNTVVQFKK